MAERGQHHDAQNGKNIPDEGGFNWEVHIAEPKMECAMSQGVRIHDPIELRIHDPIKLLTIACGAPTIPLSVSISSSMGAISSSMTDEELDSESTLSTLQGAGGSLRLIRSGG